MTNYLLTVLGVSESEKYCQDIAIAITPVVDSPNLKFDYNLGTILFHFASEVNKIELFDYVTGVLYGISDSFILTEVTDDSMISLPDNIKNNLFDLESSLNDGLGYEMDRIKNNLDFVEGIEDEEENFMMLIGNLKDKMKKPTLNEILDKISSNGFESLTPFEKDELENYSKK